MAVTAYELRDGAATDKDVQGFQGAFSDACLSILAVETCFLGPRLRLRYRFRNCAEINYRIGIESLFAVE